MKKMKPSGVEWIGDIPQEWEIALIKYSIKWKSEKGKPDATVLSLYRDYGIVPKDSRDDNHNVTSLDTSGYKVVDIGDFVINKMKAWQGSMAISSYKGIVSPAYHVCEITDDKVYRNYFHYLLRSDLYITEYTRLSKGMRIGQWDLDFNDFKNLPFLIPPISEQQRIAEFLDRKCAEIDSIIGKTKATVEEYRALKQAVITQAVTKGIRPDRPMKDSGIEWIGEIPQEWSKDKVFRSFSIIGSGTTPKSSDDSNYEGNINWIQSGDINGEVLLSVKKHLSYEAVKEYSALRLYSSPFIVIAMYGASIGNLSISEIDSCVNQACCVLAEPKIRIKYAFYSIKAAKDYLITKAVGGGQPNISQDIVKSLWLPIPPVQEQQEISDYLDSKCAEIDRLIAAKEQLLTELESYKKSVIYEYVTGKKEV